MTYETIVRCPFTKVRELVGEWCNDVTDEVGTTFDDCYQSKVEEVENEPRSGFVPYTQGGFHGIAYATLEAAYSSGFIPAVIKPYIDQDQKDAEEQWNSENPEHTVEWIYADDSAQPDLLPGGSDEREYWREQYHEFESEWMQQGGTYFYKIRALFFDTDNSSNESGLPEVYFMVGLNTDFEYGRDNIPWLSAYGSKTQQTEWCWEKTVPVAQITPELIETMTREALAALAAL